MTPAHTESVVPLTNPVLAITNVKTNLELVRQMEGSSRRAGWFVLANEKGGIIHSGSIGKRADHLLEKEKKALFQVTELGLERVLSPSKEISGAIRTVNLERNMILSLCTAIDDSSIDFAIVLRAAVMMGGLSKDSARLIAKNVKPSEIYFKL